jgi:hypothetical protein
MRIMTRLSGRIAVAVLALAMIAIAAPVPAAQSGAPELSGVWKLNVQASTNPNGPPPPPRTKSGGDPSDSIERSTLSGDEQKRFNAIKAMAWKAPEMMAIQATPTDFKMLLDPATKQGFAHKTDNKKQTLDVPGGPADFKVKWDGKKLHREYETKDSFKCVEEYSLSADGQQMIVTVKAESGMIRNVQVGDIKRVYDRQKQ